MRSGLTHLYTGNGKGKTTAALGLLLRAHGHGRRIVLVQLLKGRDTGELHAIENLRGITVLRNASSANKQNMEEIRNQNNANLTEAYKLANAGLCDLLVLDEICVAYNNKALDTELTDKLILSKPSALELVLTGRNPPPHFLEAADYVTEFVKRKHLYENTVAAREGVEF